jgi:hypothetical protein
MEQSIGKDEIWQRDLVLGILTAQQRPPPLAFAVLFVLLSISLALFQAIVLVQRIFFSWSIPRASQG